MEEERDVATKFISSREVIDLDYWIEKVNSGGNINTFQYGANDDKKVDVSQLQGFASDGFTGSRAFEGRFMWQLDDPKADKSAQGEPGRRCRVQVEDLGNIE